MKVLFLARNIEGISTGASVVTNRNLSLVKDVFGDENVYEKYICPVQSKIKLLRLTLQKYMGGSSSEFEREVIGFIKEHRVSVVAIDSSLLGHLAKTLKREFPACRVIVFFHNTEYLYFKSLMSSTRKVWHYLSVRAAYYNELLASKYADDLVVLNERDANDLQQVYGRRGDLALPVTYTDRFDPEKVNPPAEVTALFVGTLFFPNYYGITWFIANVMPAVKCKLIIVGRGFETKAGELSSDRVKVIGTTDHIDQYYYRSSFVVAPIFTGSGMKTKTAEALMFGKNIFGTAEAFEGYGIDHQKAGALCETKEAFIQAIKDYENSPDQTGFNEFSRNYYLAHHDYNNALSKFRAYILKA